MNQRSVIEKIRTKTYRVGDDSANELKEELNSALELLSKELYAKDTHFVLELIQNADDNKYVDNITPEIQFKLGNQVLVIKNNEKGFAEENVESICRAGKSTKKKEKKQGYIGEKGIGFKSVFKVSDSPQIHSNGFHFNFKVADKDDVLGFVVPHWIENPPSWCMGSGTTIVLPAKNDKPYDDKLFENLKPELLLFLRRLRAVKIETDLGGASLDFSRKDLSDIVTLESRDHSQNGISEKVENYKIAKYQADVSEIKVKEREGFETSEIVLAFPVKDDGLPQIEDSRYVYAFLPIKKCGLQFVLQADFLLTTNREDIQDNNRWNSNLLANIPSAFVQQALPLFKQDPKLKSTFYSYLKYARLDEMFKPVMKGIFDELSEVDSVLTLEHNWRTPYEVLIGDAPVKELVNNQDLINLLSKEYVSPELHVFKDVLEELGSEDFVIEHMIQCLKNEGWVKEHIDDPIWFCKLFGYLSLKAKSDILIEEIKALKILPVTSGGLMSAKDGNIFLPFNKTTYGFEESLKMLEESVLPAVDAPNRLRVTEFLNKLGIVDAVPRVIIDKHILPEHEKKISNVNRQVFIGHIRYIKDNLNEYFESNTGSSSRNDSDRIKLGSTLFVLTNGNPPSKK